MYKHRFELPRSIIALTVAVTTLSASAVAFSESYRDDAIRPYIGGSYGRVDVDADDFGDDSDNTHAAFAGVDLGKIFGLEVGYVDFGGSDNEFFTTETKGFELSGLAHVINTEHFDLYARAGVLFWETDLDSELFGSSVDGEELFWAVGSDIYLIDSLALRLEYARYKVELEDDEVGELASGSDYNLNRLSVGVKFSF